VVGNLKDDAEHEVGVNVTIRPATSARDRNALLTIFRRQLPTLRSDLAPLESVDLLVPGAHVLLLAEADTRVVAGVWARNRTVGTAAEVPVWTLEALACRDDFEGKGAGSALLDSVIGAVASRGAKILYGTCSPAVASFYLGRGFDRTPDDASLMIGADSPPRAVVLTLEEGQCFVFRPTSRPAHGTLHTAVRGPVLEVDGLRADLAPKRALL
jgi:predicted N-acetyltransferase YhbS